MLLLATDDKKRLMVVYNHHKRAMKVDDRHADDGIGGRSNAYFDFSSLLCSP
jgi:hypothetical protein